MLLLQFLSTVVLSSSCVPSLLHIPSIEAAIGVFEGGVSMSTSDNNPLSGVNLSDFNLNDHTSLASSLTIVAILFLCLCTVSVALRVGVRLHIMHGLGLDDCMETRSCSER